LLRACETRTTNDLCEELACSASAVGVEALFVKQQYAGAKAEEHHGDSGGDAKAGNHRCAAIVAAAHDNVAGDGDEQLQDAPFE